MDFYFWKYFIGFYQSQFKRFCNWFELFLREMCFPVIYLFGFYFWKYFIWIPHVQIDLCEFFWNFLSCFEVSFENSLIFGFKSILKPFSFILFFLGCIYLSLPGPAQPPGCAAHQPPLLFFSSPFYLSPPSQIQRSRLHTPSSFKWFNPSPWFQIQRSSSFLFLSFSFFSCVSSSRAPPVRSFIKLLTEPAMARRRARRRVFRPGRFPSPSFLIMARDRF